MKLLVIFVLLFPCTVISDSQGIDSQILEIKPWLSKMDTVTLNGLKLSAPKQDIGDKGILVSNTFTILLENHGISVSAKETIGLGNISILDRNHDGKPDFLSYDFKGKDGITGIVQDINIDGQPDIRMYPETMRVEAWIQNNWYSVKKKNNQSYVVINKKWVKVVVVNGIYEISSNKAIKQTH